LGRGEAGRTGALVLFLTGGEEMSEKPLPGLNEELAASVRKMDPETKRKLLEDLRGGPTRRRRAGRPRRAALERRGLPAEPPVKVIEEGDRIRLEVAPPAAKEPRQDATMREIKQPELSSPDGQPVNVPDDLFRRLMADIDHDGSQGAGGDWDPLDHLSEDAREIVIQEESRITGRAREYGRVFDGNGVITWSGTGGERSISVPAGETTGKVFIHNHPDSNPPSWRDLVEGIADGTLELRVAAKGATYSVRFPKDSTPDLLLLEDFFRVVGAATRGEWRRRRGGGDEDSAIRAEHAILMELARRGLIDYRRITR
jgi:hypothetical protein